MSSIRKDIFTGAYVIISELRGDRPVTSRKVVYSDDDTQICPFCPGNEYMTPFELVSDKNWETRYFPNKYPALTVSGEPAVSDSLYDCCDGTGLHEIFVDTRSHTEELKDFSTKHIETVINTLRDRYLFYSEVTETKYVQIFKNKGASAGATQKHSHWQIVAGRFVPSLQQTIETSLSNYEKETGKCLYCSVLERELAERKRIIFENGSFAVIAPYASRFTYETWIMPKKHFPALSGLHGNEAAELAEAVSCVITALEGIKQNIDYNILFMDAPKTSTHSLFHWHLQILPRLGNLAGYEFSTGSYINHISPEQAAEKLRSRI